MRKNHIFVNCSNHPSSQWCAEQKEAAAKYGEVVDISFPAVDPSMTEKQISRLAAEISKEILSCDPEAVMCQGEFTLTYAIVRRLREQSIKTVAACSARTVKEMQTTAGAKKEVLFRFEGFREYE